MTNKAKFEAYAQQNCSPADFPLGSLESRARARAIVDAGSSLWIDLLLDLEALSGAERGNLLGLAKRENASRAWFAEKDRDPEDRSCTIALQELLEALNADLSDAEAAEIYSIGPRPPVRQGLKPGRAIHDWFHKHWPELKTDEEGATE